MILNIGKGWVSNEALLQSLELPQGLFVLEHSITAEVHTHLALSALYHVFFEVFKELMLCFLKGLRSDWVLKGL